MNEPKQEEGYILITSKDFEKYEPKLATDEVFDDYSHMWIGVELSTNPNFRENNTYRRKINPAVVGNENLNKLRSLRKELESIKDRLSWRVSPNRKGEHVVMDGCIVSIVNSATKALDLLNLIELAAKTLKEVE